MLTVIEYFFTFAKELIIDIQEKAIAVVAGLPSNTVYNVLYRTYYTSMKLNQCFGSGST